MKSSKFFYLTVLFFCIFFLSACSLKNSIVKGDQLKDTQITYMKSLGVLYESEEVILFDSQLDYKTSGNFFTNQGAGSYWKYKKKPEDDSVNYAKYADIENITITYSKEWDMATDIKINKKDGSSFSVYLDDQEESEKEFFNQLIKQWQTVSPK